MSKPQLFCFTYAGGTKTFFNVIEADLEGIDVVPLEYAGHGERHREDFYSDFGALADDMLRQIGGHLDREYGLFGYSMGCITLVEVLRRIIGSELPQPRNLFLAAHEPRSWSWPQHVSSGEIDEWVRQRTLKFGAVPEVLMNNKAFWRTYLPIYRADYSLIGEYAFEGLDIRSQIPATVFFSQADTPMRNMEQWSRFFPCEFHQFSGTHFFIREHHAAMGKIIKDRMGVPI